MEHPCLLLTVEWCASESKKLSLVLVKIVQVVFSSCTESLNYRTPSGIISLSKNNNRAIQVLFQIAV